MDKEGPIIRRQIVDEVRRGDFSTIALMHMAHYDASVQCYIDEAKRLSRPVDVLNIGAGDLWDLHVFISGKKVKKSTVLRSYTAIDIIDVPSPFGKKLSEQISYVGVKQDMIKDNSIPLDDESVDVVICTEFIEHIDKKSAIAVLDEAYHVLRPDGMLYITTPNREQTTRTDKYHIYEWAVEELDNELYRIGFDVCDIFGTYIDQRTFAKCNAEEQRIPKRLVKEFKDRFTANFFRLIVATPYPEYSNGIAVYARKVENGQSHKE